MYAIKYVKLVIKFSLSYYLYFLYPVTHLYMQQKKTVSISSIETVFIIKTIIIQLAIYHYSFNAFSSAARLVRITEI